MSTSRAAPKATRPVHGRVVAGVARGLAEHLRLPVWLVRLAFVGLAFASGIGIVLYAAFWAVLPLDVGSDPDVDESTLRASDTARLLALAAVVVGAALLLTAAGFDVLGGILVPVLVAAFGAALIWRQTDDEQRDDWSAAAGRAARRTAGTAATAGRWRIVLGSVLVLVALVVLVASNIPLNQAIQALAIALLFVLGVGLVIFPWVYRAWRQQTNERRELIRTQERAEIAAHVHDSVLQTLTLIQRYADNPQEVSHLARTEERALRAWLYAPTGDPTRTVGAALEQVVGEVEDAYPATIDLVTVGDTTLDTRTAALVAAAREAMVNAAQHGGGQVSVYAEIEATTAEVFVRDRGPGFELAAVPDDRHGIRQSMIGRMERNGGTASVRSHQGAGTEVHLRLPLVEESTS